METPTVNPPPTPANPQSKVPFRARLWEAWRRNQLVLVHLPLTCLGLWLTYIVLKGLDSRIGVEGFGDLFGYMLNAVRAVLIIFSAWWVKKWCWFDLHDTTEEQLFNRQKDGDRMAFWLVTRDRLEWIVLLVLATYWYTR